MLVLELEPQLEELLKQRLELLDFEPALELGLELKLVKLQVVELLRQA